MTTVYGVHCGLVEGKYFPAIETYFFRADAELRANRMVIELPIGICVKVIETEIETRDTEEIKREIIRIVSRQQIPPSKRFNLV